MELKQYWRLYMSTWYYVDGTEKVGPLEEVKIHELLKNGTLNEESYVWTKGFENWIKVKDVQELVVVLQSSHENEDIPDIDPLDGFPPIIDNTPSNVKTFSFDNLSENDKVISIKVGIDRGASETEYGPYTIKELKKAFNENRINEKTLFYIPGMKEWIFLSDMPKFKEIFGAAPPVITDIERRRNTRKPFVARMFFHDSKVLFEGVCRDISVGGMQILVAQAPFSLGDEINLNVHPDNDAYNFVATALVVRRLAADQGFAIRFVNLSSEAENAINSYLSMS